MCIYTTSRTLTKHRRRQVMCSCDWSRFYTKWVIDSPKHNLRASRDTGSGCSHELRGTKRGWNWASPRTKPQSGTAQAPVGSRQHRPTNTTKTMCRRASVSTKAMCGWGPMATQGSTKAICGWGSVSTKTPQGLGYKVWDGCMLHHCVRPAVHGMGAWGAAA
jgi:hypothetical protein